MEGAKIPGSFCWLCFFDFLRCLVVKILQGIVVNNIKYQNNEIQKSTETCDKVGVVLVSSKNIFVLVSSVNLAS